MKPEARENIRYPKIAAELKQMVDVDQAMRERALQEEDFWDYEIDAKNTARLKEIIKEIGLPSAEKVGMIAANDAWLLAQHADRDIAFQITYLELMKAARPTKEEKRHIAYLEDRIRVNQKRGQLYGTQFRQKDGQHVPCPIEDPENIDARRAAVGIGPLSEQIEHMYEKYPVPEKK